MQIGRVYGPPLRCKQARAAHRDECLLEQHLALHGARDPGDECDPDVERAPCGIDLIVIGLELDDDLGVCASERGEPRHQPQFGEGLHCDELQRPGVRAGTKALGGVVEGGEGVPDLHVERLSTPAQRDRARLAFEQLLA